MGGFVGRKEACVAGKGGYGGVELLKVKVVEAGKGQGSTWEYCSNCYSCIWG